MTSVFVILCVHIVRLALAYKPQVLLLVHVRKEAFGVFSGIILRKNYRHCSYLTTQHLYHNYLLAADQAVPWLRRLVAGHSQRRYCFALQISLCEICGGQSDSVTGLYPTFSGFPCPFQCIFIHHLVDKQ
jgi:hypothetical protein